MFKKRRLDLQLFTEGGSATGGGEGKGSQAEVRIGDTLEDGTVVDANLASSMREDADMYPATKPAARAQGRQASGKSGQQAEAGDEPTPEQWAEAKKKFAKFYGSDVQSAVKDRFKNQADANQRLERLSPMLQALMKKTGAESEEELQSLIMNDDSLYEEDAEAAGMSVSAYKNFKKLQDEHDQMVASQEKAQQEQALAQHVNTIREQAEELKQLFPGFNLEEEAQNPEFIKLTRPGGVSVKQAYFALHGDELIPQLMAYGVQTGKDQISRSIQANKARPVEGASLRGSAGASVRLDNENMTDERYEEIKRRTLREGPQML